MKNFDIKNIDLKLLMVFLTVYYERSVSGAADKLDMGQSLVSHSLDRLRKYFDDPLFVRAGRNIAPTNRAIEIAPEIESIVLRLKSLSKRPSFTPSELTAYFVIAANDYERRRIMPAAFRNVTNTAPNVSLILLNTSNKMVEPLRNREWDLVISPQAPPNTGDFHSRDLFTDRFVCFYDKSQISADEIADGYTNLDHAIVRFQGDPVSTIDLALERLGQKRKVKLTAPSFEALPDFMAGTRLIATLPSQLRESIFSSFAHTEVPFQIAPLQFRLIWHKATHQSPEHIWFRRLIVESMT